MENKRVAFEQSVPVPAPHAGVVDKVLVYKERNGADACKVRVRKLRIPTVGDKFASRSAQKVSFVSFNFVINPANNFSSFSGTRHALPRRRPALYARRHDSRYNLNPHAIPSRMTMAQILESVKSKYGCYAGLQDGSPFNGDTAEDLQEMLHSMGFQRRRDTSHAVWRYWREVQGAHLHRAYLLSGEFMLFNFDLFNLH